MKHIIKNSENTDPAYQGGQKGAYRIQGGQSNRSISMVEKEYVADLTSNGAMT